MARSQNLDTDQILYAASDASRDTRFVQIVDPDTFDVAVEAVRGSVFRGYHNIAMLLDDGALVRH